MSNLKRPLLKNFYLSLTGNEPVVNNFSLYNNFPTGLMIISCSDPMSCSRGDNLNKNEKNFEEGDEIKIKYINQKVSDLFDIKESDSPSKIHESLNLFKKFDKTQIIEETLDNILFNKNRLCEFYGSFKNRRSLIYVKYKINKEDLYICADYYNGERKIIQNQLFQGLKFQYIATLFHELYNPINALLFMIDMDQNGSDNREEFIKSHLCNPNNMLSEIEESQISDLTDNDNHKFNINFQDNDNNFIRKNKMMIGLYKKN